jgi:hypothetical protein
MHFVFAHAANQTVAHPTPPLLPYSSLSSNHCHHRRTASSLPHPRASTIVPPLRAVGAKPSKLMCDGRHRTVNLLRHQGSCSLSPPTPVDGSAGGCARWHRRCPCCGEILSPPRIQLEAEVARPALLQVSPLSCLPQLHVRCSRCSVHLAIDPRSHSFPCGFITKVKP